MVKSKPDLYLEEYADWYHDQTGITLTTSTVGTYFLRMGYTQKKMNLIAYERNEVERAEFINFISQFDSSMFIFVDETSKDSRTSQRKYMCGQRGQRISVKGDVVNKQRISLMAGLDITNGITGKMVVDGEFNAEFFNLAIECAIMPHVGNFARGEPRSIVIMDNCAIYYDDTVRMVRARGGILVFLPAYSPNFNPIEEAINQIKAFLLANRGLCDQNPKLAVLNACDSITAKNAQNYFRDCEY